MINPTISIIVPVYNVEKYIHRCLDSIIAQTFTDWECILVDDGSTDKSGIICDEYEKTDSRIKVIHKHNGGVSSARNCGLEHVTGEWLCFLDSDDWWSEEFLMNFSNDLTPEYDLLMQGYILENEIIGISYSCPLPTKIYQTPAEVVSFLDNYKNYHNGYLWHKVFRFSIFKKNKIKFPEGISFAEDGLVFLQYVKYVKKTKSISKIGYHYRRIQGSLTKTGDGQSDNTYRYLIENYLISLSELSHPDYKDSLKIFGWRLLVSWIISRNIGNKDCFNRIMPYTQNLIKKYGLNEVNHTTLIHRLLIWICGHWKISFSRYLVKILVILRLKEISIKKLLNK